MRRTPENCRGAIFRKAEGKHTTQINVRQKPPRRLTGPYLILTRLSAPHAIFWRRTAKILQFLPPFHGLRHLPSAFKLLLIDLSAIHQVLNNIRGASHSSWNIHAGPLQDRSRILH